MPGPLRTYRIKKNRLDRAYLQGWVIDGSCLRTTEDSNRHTLFLGKLDSNQSDYTWGRLRFDSDVRFEAVLRIYAFATNETDIMWHKRLVPLDGYLLDPLEPLSGKEALFASMNAATAAGANDMLLTGQNGRYLHIFIDLIGTGTASINNITVYAPCDNFIMSLPEIYRDNGDFLSRYMSVFYSMYSDLQFTIDNIDRYIDTGQTDKNALHIFAGWLGLSLDGDFLEDAHLRLLIREGFNLIKRKGTREAIEGIVKIFTKSEFYIVERRFVSKYDSMETVRINERLYGNNPYGFSVLIHCEADEGLHLRLKYLINQFKPSRSEATIVFLSDCGYLNGHCYMDVNARIIKTDTGSTDKKACLNGMTLMA